MKRLKGIPPGTASDTLLVAGLIAAVGFAFTFGDQYAIGASSVALLILSYLTAPAKE